MNSYSEQCTKSKLGRVHSAHTQGPRLHTGRTRTAPCHGPLPGRIMVMSQACTGRVVAHRRCVARRLLCAMSLSGPRRVAAPLVVTQRIVSRYNSYSALCSPCHVHPAPYCSTHAAVSSAVSRVVSRPKSRPQPRYNICITPPPPAR